MTDDDTPAAQARRAGAAELAVLLADARARTLATFDAWRDAVGDAGLEVPYHPDLNPPRWELGHIAWFAEAWLDRNPQRALGHAADPDVPRRPPRRPEADALYDSSRVAHRDRWRNPLPPLAALRDDLDAQLESALALLHSSDDHDDTLYFHRLALFHEDMHREAALFMAQQLGVPLATAPRCAPSQSPSLSPAYVTPHRELRIDAGRHLAGWTGTGFAFDNELGAGPVDLPAFRIDAAPVDWTRFIAFVDAGGYASDAFWTADGRAWRDAMAAVHPRYLRRAGTRWERQAFGAWIDLDPALPAMHLSAHEAEAWCAWAGRRLPTELEWERAACTAGAAFAWGRVWEWTASRFEPYPGFVAHPYRDYSAPWFGTRRVLRGGSPCTTGRMKHPRYRNFFPPGRNDIAAGFRTCARFAD